MSVFNSMKINASGLTLERLKMDVISTNIANAKTTRTENGGPYRKKQVIFEESLKRVRNNSINKYRNGYMSFGVRVTGIEENEEGHKLVYEPNHPDANEEGYVLMPNVNMIDEMISLIETQRAYEANVVAFNTSKNLYKKALEISKG